MKTAPRFVLRLYVAGDGPHSALAIVNLKAFCLAHLPERHEIEIVDVLTDQRRALADGVMLTPLLVKVSPTPVRRVVGTLSKLEPMLQALGLINSTS